MFLSKKLVLDKICFHLSPLTFILQLLFLLFRFQFNQVLISFILKSREFFLLDFGHFMALTLNDVLYDELSLAFGTQFFDCLEVCGLLQLLDLRNLLFDFTLLICVVITAGGNLEELLLFFHSLFSYALLPLFLQILCCFFCILSFLLQFLLIQFLAFRFFLLIFAELF